MISLTYNGKMVSGKNQQRIAFIRGRMMKFPDSNFKKWRAEFQHQVAKQVTGQMVYAVKGGLAIFPGPVWFSVDYWPGDRIGRDMTGIMDAIFHACEAKNGGLIVENDNQFQECRGWVTHPVDREDPRLILNIDRRNQSAEQII